MSNITKGTTISVGLLLGILGPVLGAFYMYGQADQRIAFLERQVVEMKNDIASLEKTIREIHYFGGVAR